jgi:DNA-binding SARP family transcriptional activator
MAAPIHIQMFGSLRVSSAGEEVDRFHTRKAASLLARLAGFPERPHPREELAGLFWPDLDESAARNNLRQTLYGLRRTLSAAGLNSNLIETDKEYVRLASARFVIDVCEFESSIRSARSNGSALDVACVLHALELYRGDLLPGLYDEWIFPERRRLQALFQRSVHDLVAALVADGDPLRALPCALQALAADPCDEEAHLDLMRIYATAGDRAGVQRQRMGMEAALREELGEAPSVGAVKTAASLYDLAVRYDCGAPGLPETAAPSPKCVTMEAVTQRPAVRARNVTRRVVTVARAACIFALVLVLSGVPPAKTVAPSGKPAIIAPDDSRFALLASLRGGRPITELPRDERIARQRADLCVALGEGFFASWYGPNEEAWLQRLASANDDLRAALHWLVDKDPDRAVQLSGALVRFWYVRGFQREGYRWLAESLSRARTYRSSARARALVGSCFLAPVRDPRSEAQCRDALAIYRERRDRWGEAHALRHLGYLANTKHDRVTAAELFVQALTIFSDLKDERGQAVTLLCIGFLGPNRSAAAHGMVVNQEGAVRSLALFTKLRNVWGESMAREALGSIALELSDRRTAEERTRESLALIETSNGMTVRECLNRGRLASLRGDLESARKSCAEGLAIARDLGDSEDAMPLLKSEINFIDTSGGDASRVAGGLAALEQRLGLRKRQAAAQYWPCLAKSLGSRRAKAAFRDGLTMSWEQTVDAAVGAR